MFTASHNPAQYNGVKFCRSGARPVGIDSGLAEISDTAAAVLDGAHGRVMGGRVAYFLVGENLLRLVWEDAGDWLPAGLLDTFMSGGSSEVAYLAAAALLAIYVVAATTTLSTVFVRRDITD